MTFTEQRYGQVEKEALAIALGCKRFLQYLLGLTLEIETAVSFILGKQSQLRNCH